MSFAPNQSSIKILIFAILSAWSILAKAQGIELNPEIKDKVKTFYGASAVERLNALEKLIARLQGSSDEEKLKEVNYFYNNLRFLSDNNHWALEDYWATPVELIASNGGDCEDFAIAKYLTLRSLGLSDEQLRLTYVKALKINQAHMVLTYFPNAQAEPLVLDNLIDTIELASARDDLEPVYSFNGQGLWLAKKRGGVVRLGNGDDVTMWRELQQRVVSHQVAIPGRGGT